MTKYKLGSEMFGYTYDTLMKNYPSLAELPFISRDKFSTNQDDPYEMDDYLIVTINDEEDLNTLRKTIEKDISSPDYTGLVVDVFNAEELKYEKYNDIIISYK